MSLYISPYFYCACPQGTNHSNGDSKSTNHLNTLHHLLNEANEQLNIKTPLQIGRVKNIKCPIDVFTAIGLAAHKTKNAKFLISGQNIELLNSANMAEDKISDIIFRNQKAEKPFYPSAKCYLMKKRDPNDNFTVRFLYIKNIHQVSERVKTLKIDRAMRNKDEDTIRLLNEPENMSLQIQHM